MEVDLRSETCRLVVCGALVAAGVVTAAALAPAAAGAAAGVGVFTGLVNALSGIAGNIFATDGHAKLAKRLDDPERLLQNHDLTRAVADAIAVELRAAANGLDGRGPLAMVGRWVRGTAEPAVALRRMADAAGEWWPDFVARLPARGQGSPARGRGVTEAEITGYFSEPTGASAPPPALTPQVWQELLLNLADHAGVKCPAPEAVAQRLHTQFAVALREIIKHDAAAGGKAYPALHLLLLGDIVGMVRELGEAMTSHEEADVDRHQEVMEAFSKLRPAVETAMTELGPLVDAAVRTNVEASLRVTLNAVADTERRLADLVKQEHETTRESIVDAKDEIINVIREERAPAPLPPPPATIPKPRALAIYEPRDEEKEAVATAMFRADGTFGVAALVGMAGVGKSYLAELIAWEHDKRLPGGMLRLELAPGQDFDPKAMAADLCARYGVTVGAGVDPVLALHGRLASPLAMLLIENVDAHDQVAPVSALLKALPGVPALVTGRCSTLAAIQGWVVQKIEPFGRAKSDSLLDREMQEKKARLSEDDRKRLFEELGGVPLAVAIAASHIRRAGGRASAFLKSFHDRRADIAHAPGSEEEKNLRATVAVSVAALMDVAGPEAVGGLARMAWGPPAGMGADLARTVSGLDEAAFAACCASALELSLVRLREGAAGIEHVSFHPLVAEVLRVEGDQEAPAL
ncbi:MAG: hypothetical protein NT029_09655 [Armatimonadetes bacterium]|nr:hypothetical protein [Armatimonadota bacterium]